MTAAPGGIALLQGGLRELGYGKDLVRHRVIVSDNDILDLLAYSSPDIQDFSTTAIAGALVATDGDRALGRVLDLARFVAAPAALISQDVRVQLFSVATRKQGDRLVEVFPAATPLVGLRRYAPDLGPGALTRAKRAGRQLSLFPLDVRLLATTREKWGSQLSGLVEEALEAAARVEKGDVPAGVKSVVTAMALLVVRDRYGLKGSSGRAIADEALQIHGPVFDWLGRLPLESRGLATALSVMREGADFRWFDGAIISRLYDELLVTEGVRRALAIHYTPQELAQRMAAAIPFESLKPESRSVLDPACGSGTLLAAAHARLSDLAPTLLAGSEAYEMLRTSIRGWDVDQVAAEIARLSLVVQSLPYGNHWSVEERNALGPIGPKDAAQVVISNPPWQLEQGQSEDVAEDFLARMRSLVMPGGFLAAVLPAAWLLREKSRASRQGLLEGFDVFEVWRLPRDVFTQARHASCVVVGERKTVGRTRRHYVYRQVAPGRDRIRDFFTTGAAAFNGIGVLPPREPGSLVVTPFDELDHLRAFPRLGDSVKVVSGVVQKKVPQLRDEGSLAVLPRGVPSAPLQVVTRNQVAYVASLNDFALESRNIEWLQKKKLLLQVQRFPDNAWRSRPMLDEIGVVPNDSWGSVIPLQSNTRATRAALLALFASAFASTWFYSTVATKRLPTSALRAFPLPKGGLEVLVRELASLGEAILKTRDETAIFDDIDSRVDALYAIPSRTRKVLRSLLAGQTGPEGRVRYEPAAPPRTLSPNVPVSERPGALLRIHNGKLWIWTPGGPEQGVPVRLPYKLPGWVCEEGQTFQVVGSSLVDADYVFQRSTHLSDSDLFGVREDEDSIRLRP
jgi:SAM-dependent methyltransferase